MDSARLRVGLARDRPTSAFLESLWIGHCQIQ